MIVLLGVSFCYSV